MKKVHDLKVKVDYSQLDLFDKSLNAFREHVVATMFKVEQNNRESELRYRNYLGLRLLAYDLEGNPLGAGGAMSYEQFKLEEGTPVEGVVGLHFPDYRIGDALTEEQHDAITTLANRHKIKES